jgi:hypothetical protein
MQPRNEMCGTLKMKSLCLESVVSGHFFMGGTT